MTLLEGMKNRDGQEHENSSTKLLCRYCCWMRHPFISNTSVDLFGQ